MKIDLKTIVHLEALARIELTPEEREVLSGQLDRIVEYVEQIQGLDTDDVAPTSAVVHENASPKTLLGIIDPDSVV